MKKGMKKKNKILVFIGIVLTIVLISQGKIYFIYNNQEVSDVIEVEYRNDEDFIIDAYYKFPLSNNSYKLKTVYKNSFSGFKLGDNVIELKASAFFSTNSKDIIVHVTDVCGPVIELINDEKYIISDSEKYVEEGYRAIDDYDGDISNLVVVSEMINHKITYTATDSSGNTTSVVRSVKYYSNSAPVITVDCDYISIEKGNSLLAPDYDAYDKKDGNLKALVVVNNNVDVNQVGQYYISYAVTNSSKKKITLEIPVYVYEKQKDSLNENDVKKKIVYMTFDDGPSQYTKDLLDTLDKYNVKATFFVTGNNEKYRSSIVDAYQRGHTIGLHSYSHNYAKIYRSVKSFYDDLGQVDAMVYDLIDVHPNIFRFAGGSSNTVSKKICVGIMSDLVKTTKGRGYRYFDWNVTGGDSGKPTTADKVFNRVVKGIKRKNIAVNLQHDTKGFSVQAVDQIIAWGLANGYSFLPISDLTTYTSHHGVAN